MEKARMPGLALLLLLALLVAGCDSLAVMPVEAPAHTAAVATASPATSSPAASSTPDDTQTPEPTETPSAEPTSSPTDSPAVTAEPAATPQPLSNELNLLFTGDIMFHGPTVKLQWDAKQGKYDFSSYFERIAPIVSKADFAVGNLESPVWDVKKSKLAELRFCAPAEAITALKDAGFDVLCTANNHAMDQGLSALANTIDVIGKGGMMTTGTYRNAEERDAVTMLEGNGVKVALFAYARNVNLSWRNDKGMGVNCIDVARMTNDVKRARAAGADAVIFFLHFGTEYTHDPDGYQKAIARALKAAGADAVIGHHPHVLQPLVVDPQGKLTAWSLGNVVTVKDSWERQFAALLRLTVRKDPNTGAIGIQNVSYVPTWAKAIAAPGEKPKMRVFDLRQALADCEAGTDPMLPKKYLRELQKGMNIAATVLGAQYMEPLNGP